MTRKPHGETAASSTKAVLKRTTTSLAKILAKRLIPGGGLGLDIHETLAKEVAIRREATQKQRLQRFIEEILSGEDDPATDAREFALEDFVTMITSVVQDAEDDKIYFYAALWKALVHGTIAPEYKRHFLRSSRELAFADIDLMRQAYICSRYQLKNSSGIVAQLNDLLLKPSAPLQRVSIENLIRLGYITREAAGVTSNSVPVRP